VIHIIHSRWLGPTNGNVPNGCLFMNTLVAGFVRLLGLGDVATTSGYQQFKDRRLHTGPLWTQGSDRCRGFGSSQVDEFLEVRSLQR
jgi:hypothetical protein